jgi:4-hydroxymandelate oxidase
MRPLDGTIRLMRWIDTLEAAAAEKLPEPVHRYFRQGSAGGISVGEATAAWSSYRFRPHVLTDVSTVDLRTTALGTPIDVPVMVAPTTLQRQADPKGEAAMAAGVAAANSVLGVSSNAGMTFAEIGAVGAPWWLQIYVVKNRDVTLRMLDKAVAGGARAVVLSADTPVVGRKEDDGPSVWEVIPDGHLLANLDDDEYADGDLGKADDLTPDVIGWLGERTGLPVVVKGVLRGDDAKRCADAGAAGVIVSNHGGRQLDRTPSAIEMLPEIVEAVAGRAEVYVDGGVRRGVDVLTALAVGAQGVFVGRPFFFALAAGEAGVARALELLAAEVSNDMALLGTRTISEIGRKHARGGA